MRASGRITAEDARIIGGWRVPLGPAGDVQVVGTLVSTPEGRVWHAAPTCPEIALRGADADRVGASVLRLAEAVRVEWCTGCCARGYPLHGERIRDAVTAARRAAQLADPLLVEVHYTGRHVAHTAGPLATDETPVADLWVRFEDLSVRLDEFEEALRALPGCWLRGRLIGGWLRGQLAVLRRLLTFDDHRLGAELLARAFSPRAAFAALHRALDGLPVGTTYDLATSSHEAWIRSLRERASLAEARDAAIGAVDTVVDDPDLHDLCRQQVAAALPRWAQAPSGSDWRRDTWVVIGGAAARGRFRPLAARWGVDSPAVGTRARYVVLRLPRVVADVVTGATVDAAVLDPTVAEARVRRAAAALAGPTGTVADFARAVPRARALVATDALAFADDA